MCSGAPRPDERTVCRRAGRDKSPTVASASGTFGSSGGRPTAVYGPADLRVDKTMKRFGTSLTAILLALLAAAAPVQAASCTGASHQPMLTNGGASPAVGTTTTPITFAVVYADSGGCAPSSVTVTVAGTGTFVMNASGSSWASGVTYTVSLTLGAGFHGYSFSATSGEGNGTKSTTLTTVSPAALTINAPPPPPTAAPTPPPTPRPSTPKPAPQPPPPTAAPTPPPSATPTPGETPTPGLTPTLPGSASPTATTLNLHDSWSPAPAAAPLGTPILSSDGSPFAVPAVFLTYLVTTAAGLAFFAFLMRSPMRPATATAAVGRAPISAEAPPVTLDAAAPAVERIPGKVTPLPPMRELVPPVDPDLLRDPDEVGPSPDEAGLPRWLRPSVRAARGGMTELRQRNWRA